MRQRPNRLISRHARPTHFLMATTESILGRAEPGGRPTSDGKHALLAAKPVELRCPADQRDERVFQFTMIASGTHAMPQKNSTPPATLWPCGSSTRLITHNTTPSARTNQTAGCLPNHT